MNPKFFIDRPIFACCISVLMVILGVIGIFALPVEQFPDIAPPTVSVNATYPGASAETVQKSVIIPLEEKINGVDNMLYMNSSASNAGTATITVTFRQGTDPNMAAVNVQNRVAIASSSLPAAVTQVGVVTEKRQTSQLKIIALYTENDSYDETFIANYAKINITPQIQRIAGVGGVTVFGADYSMRLWLNPQKMAQFGLVPADIARVLDEQNIEYATGTFGNNSDHTFLYTMKYRGRYEKPEEFGELVIKSLPNGNVLQIADVGYTELGAESYDYMSRINGKVGTVFMVFQTAGSNASQIITEINELEERIRADLPSGLKLVDLYSTKDFLDASIHEVIHTLIEAIVLVILVVYFFLQSFRSTVIPLISILVSLIFTFCLILVAGFSINLLTLFAMVLVIGTVVDDAIVVVEAVQAKFDEGYTSPYKATVDAMNGIGGAILTTSLVFMSVFVPVCFVGGTSGTFYTQFGVTMAVAVGTSAVNALTLSPALCALFMKKTNYEDPKIKDKFTTRFHIAFESSFKAIINKYAKVLILLFKRKSISAAILIGSSVALVLLGMRTPTGLIPDEDTGTIFVSVVTSPGYTLNETNKTLAEVSKRLEDIPQIKVQATVSGYNLMSSAQSKSGGTFIISLKNWAERKGAENSKDAIIAEIMQRTADIKTAYIFAFAPPMISGYGVTSGLEMVVQDKQGKGINELFNVTQGFLAALNQRPEFLAAISTFDPRFPQYEVEVDAAVCIKKGVSPKDVLSAISMYVGGNYASNVNLYSKLYKVYIQALPEETLDEGSLSNFFVRNSNGDMLPIAQFVHLKKIYGPENVTRFNLFSNIAVNIALAPGYSSGEGIAAVAEVAKETLPMGFGYEFSGLTRDEASQGNSTIIVYSLCLIFIYLILCSLYESLLIPIAVMLSIPCALLGSFIFANLMGVQNNIYMQTGLIMLIGLIAKTAILLTEYSSACRRQGMSIAQAALSAAKIRLRPILMTSICMVVGLMPLVVASGVGANGNRSLGVSVVGGMLVGIVALIFITPVMFIVMQSLQELISKHFKREKE
ncbi:MAG: efflux RND transporter permease subunit [Succinivibrio sp.]|nr:efflux RND transporter permease subunit [Succinivibrio sp.]